LIAGGQRSVVASSIPSLRIEMTEHFPPINSCALFIRNGIALSKSSGLRHRGGYPPSVVCLKLADHIQC
jgi:hypothetical protein